MRVCSKHNPVSVSVHDVPYLIEFHEERPGVFVADLDADVAQHLLFRIGEAGGFWTDEIAPEQHAPKSPEPTANEPLVENEAPPVPEESGEIPSDAEPVSRKKKR